MSSEPALRLFVAAAVPADQLDWLEREMRPLKDLFEGARWTARDNQHVTLKFLGSTAPSLAGEVVLRCSRVATEVVPSHLAFDALGAFPGPRRARVLWAGLQDPADTLARLAAGLDRALEPLGFGAEKRGFSPHLTLARFKVPQRVDPLPALGPPPRAFGLTEFGLWRSRLSSRGARFEVLERFTLG